MVTILRDFVAQLYLLYYTYNTDIVGITVQKIDYMHVLIEDDYSNLPGETTYHYSVFLIVRLKQIFARSRKSLIFKNLKRKDFCKLINLDIERAYHSFVFFSIGPYVFEWFTQMWHQICKICFPLFFHFDVCIRTFLLKLEMNQHGIFYIIWRT